MNERLKEKTLEALSSVLPITAVVLLLSITLVPIPAGIMLLFLSGAVMLILGMGFFSLGADIAMLPMGQSIGTKISKTRRIFHAFFAYFSIGVIITIAEPDLQVLATQVAAIPNHVLILTVALGVGFFLMIALFRIFFKITFSRLLIFCYLLIFVIAFFVPEHYLTVAFDSGGVATGPLVVPFIMALGIGLSRLRSDKNSQDDSFGLVAFCSIGPILAVLILSIFFRDSTSELPGTSMALIENTKDIIYALSTSLPIYLKDVLFALLPIAALFVVFQLLSKRFHGQSLGRIVVGLLYTYVGLVLFLTGVNMGFLPVGNFIGNALAASQFKQALIPIGMVIGYFLVVAEPAVPVLAKQVEEVSNGAISQTLLVRTLSIGVACAVGLSMLRILFHLPFIYFAIPCYAIALILSFFVPKLFTAIAFDSGAVASGPMAATFLLPFSMGACSAIGGDILLDAFGTVAMVAMTPPIAIQILGFIFSKRMATTHIPIPTTDALAEELAEQMVYYNEEVPEA